MAFEKVMRYLLLFEGFQESEFIRTATYKGYVKSGFVKPNLDDMLDWMNTIKKKMESATGEELEWLNKEMKAINYILKKHYK